MLDLSATLQNSITNRLGWLVCGSAIVFVGCSEDTAIRTYTVSKKDAAQRRVFPKQEQDVRLQEQQMLGAIVPNDNSAWFFKLLGDPEKVSKQQEQFRNIVDSVQFTSSGDPSWTLAEGWTELRSRGITYAQLIQQEEGLTATVTQLPVPSAADEQEWRTYVIKNINRWRDQLKLEAQDWGSMASELEEVPELSQGSAKAYFVSLIGKGSGGMGAGMAPFAAQGNSAAAPTKEKSPTDSSAAPTSSLDFAAPEGWKEIEASGMRRAAFSVEEDGMSGEVTVIAAGGDIQANIGIWLGQVSLEKSETLVQSILDSAQKVSVQGIEAHVYTLDGSTAEGSQSILVADVPWQSGESLFVKLKGDSKLVESQREKYLEFLKSISW